MYAKMFAKEELGPGLHVHDNDLHGLIDSKEKRACNHPPIKIQTEAKNSNTDYSEHCS